MTSLAPDSIRADLFMTWLTHGDVNINLPGSDDNTALHFAVGAFMLEWQF